MKISIFGMGYVGVVSGACLLRDGHEVVGIDPVESKVNDLKQGKSPVLEPGVPEMLEEGYQAGRLRASTDPFDGVDGVDLVWICVGTPSTEAGGLDLTYVRKVVAEIGRGLKATDSRPLLVLRSTILPGSTENEFIPILENESGLEVGKDIQVVFHPEFLRESTAVADFDAPPKIVIGEPEKGAGEVLVSLYSDYEAPMFQLGLGEAEMVKYCDNLFHALKVTFANEVGAIARSAGIDARRVSKVFCADTKLNISKNYLRPGFAFGGSCLPKDLRAILRYATVQSVKVPMLKGMLESNLVRIDDLLARVLAYRPERVGLVGLAFKAGTDDMRESPYVTVAKALIGEGITLRIHDPGVYVEKLVGSNRQAVESSLGHLRDLLVEGIDDLDDCDLIIVNHATVEQSAVTRWMAGGRRVIDLADLGALDGEAENYEGIAW